MESRFCGVRLVDRIVGLYCSESLCSSSCNVSNEGLSFTSSCQHLNIMS